MSEIKKSFGEILQKLRKDKKALFIVLIGLLGMLMIIVSELPVFSVKDESKATNEGTFVGENLEKEVEKLISQVKGAGKVSVMLTYESNEEQVFAKDTETKIQGENESQSNQQHIIVDSARGETGLLLKIIYPKIRGVAVVCTGGDDPRVRSEISSLISALFDIGSNRISIARRAEEE